MEVKWSKKRQLERNRRSESKEEEEPLLEAVIRERLVKTLQAEDLACVRVCVCVCKVRKSAMAL
jgi:hypothetical protein